MMASLACLMLLTLLQGSAYFSLSSGQFRSYMSELSEKVAGDISQNIDNYFSELDNQLDTVYQSPGYLATLSTDTIVSEEPTRSLLARTEFFSALRSIYIYNRSHHIRGYYTRVKTNQNFDVLAEDDAAAQSVIDFIDNSRERIAVLCSTDKNGVAYLRVVKRIYQDAGYTEAGYIVCDLLPSGVAKLVAEGACSADQYVWILSQNAQGCYLSAAPNRSAQEYMSSHLSLFNSASFETMSGGNHYFQTDPSAYGIVTCMFTDETRLRNNYAMIFSVLGQGLLCALAVFLGFGFFMDRRVNRRIHGVTDVLSRIADGDTRQRLPVEGRDEIAVICESFNDMLEQLAARTAAEEQARRALDDARYHALQAQVNPHFLYNTMENIGAIAISRDCPVINDMCVALAQMLRYSIQADDAGKCVTLRDEMAYVDDYMLIINVRMNNEVQMRAEIDDALWDVELPRLSIQPLVENSVRHGLRHKRGEKLLTVRAERCGGDALITVEDNGLGMDETLLNQIIHSEVVHCGNHTSIGISNIHQRVQLLCGPEYGLSAKVADGVTRMLLRLPLHRTEGIHS